MSLPMALDTNVLVRLLVNDDPVQALRAAESIDASAACFVPITVVLELEWVLCGAYKLPREAVISAFEGLLAIKRCISSRKRSCGKLWPGTVGALILPMRCTWRAVRAVERSSVLICNWHSWPPSSSSSQGCRALDLAG